MKDSATAEICIASAFTDCRAGAARAPSSGAPGPCHPIGRFRSDLSRYSQLPPAG